MASTYTTKNGLEKIGAGEQSGTWGSTTNTNFDLIDEAISGQVDITLTSSHITSGGAYSLVVTDGTSSVGRNAYVSVIDGGDITATGYVKFAPSTAEKICLIANNLSGGRDLFVFQGTYSTGRDLLISNGKAAWVRFTGTGDSTATATNINTSIEFASLSATGAITAGTTITAAGNVTGANLSGSNTGDQTNISGNAATVTTNANLTGHVTSSGNAAVLGSFTVAQLNTAISNATLSGSNTGDQTNISGNAATVTTNANLTGHVTSSGNAAVLGSFTVAQLNTALSDGSVASPNVGTTAFTMGLTINNSATGITFLSRFTDYQRLGGIVFFTALFTLSSKGASVGIVRLTGFPVGVDVFSKGYSVSVGHCSGASLTASTSITGRFVGSSTLELNVFDSTGGTSNLTSADITDDFSLSFSGFYFV